MNSIKELQIDLDIWKDYNWNKSSPKRMVLWRYSYANFSG